MDCVASKVKTLNINNITRAVDLYQSKISKRYEDVIVVLLHKGGNGFFITKLLERYGKLLKWIKLEATPERELIITGIQPNFVRHISYEISLTFNTEFRDKDLVALCDVTEPHTFNGFSPDVAIYPEGKNWDERINGKTVPYPRVVMMIEVGTKSAKALRMTGWNLFHSEYEHFTLFIVLKQYGPKKFVLVQYENYNDNVISFNPHFKSIQYLGDEPTKEELKDWYAKIQHTEGYEICCLGPIPEQVTPIKNSILEIPSRDLYYHVRKKHNQLFKIDLENIVFDNRFMVE